MPKLLLSLLPIFTVLVCSCSTNKMRTEVFSERAPAGQVNSEVNDSFVKAACSNDLTLIQVFSNYPGIDASTVSEKFQDSAFTCAARFYPNSALPKLLELFPAQFLPYQKGSLGKTPIELISDNYSISRVVLKNYYLKIEMDNPSTQALLDSLGNNLTDALSTDPAFLDFFWRTLSPRISFAKISASSLSTNYLIVAKKMGPSYLNIFADKMLAETNISSFLIYEESKDLYFECVENGSSAKYCPLFLRGIISPSMAGLLLDRYINQRDEAHLRSLVARGVKFNPKILSNYLDRFGWFELVYILDIPVEVVRESHKFLDELLFQPEKWQILVTTKKLDPYMAEYYTKPLLSIKTRELPATSGKCFVSANSYPVEPYFIPVDISCVGRAQDLGQFNYYPNGDLVEVSTESKKINLDTSIVFFNYEGNVGFVYIKDIRNRKVVKIASLPFRYEQSVIIRSGQKIIAYNIDELSAYVYDWNQDNESAALNSTLSDSYTKTMRSTFQKSSSLQSVSDRFVADCSTKRIYSPDFLKFEVYNEMKCAGSKANFSFVGKTIVTEFSENSDNCILTGGVKYCGSAAALTSPTEVILVRQRPEAGRGDLARINMLSRNFGGPRYLLTKVPPFSKMFIDSNNKPREVEMRLENLGDKSVLKIFKFSLTCVVEGSKWTGCD